MSLPQEAFGAISSGTPRLLDLHQPGRGCENNGEKSDEWGPLVALNILEGQYSNQKVVVWREAEAGKPVPWSC